MIINRDLLEKYAREIEVELDNNAISRFEVYAGELIGTNRKYNLTAITDPDEIVVKHFIDSLIILKYFDLDYKTKIIDIGSGAGFPGIPLLIAKDNQLKVTFLDSVRKKLLFIENALRSTGMEGELLCMRAEDAGKKEEYREKFDVATARAVASMSALCEYCLPFVKLGGYFIALKGSGDELSSAENAIKTLGGEIESNVSYKLPNGDSRTMVIIKKISQTPTEYPRKAKKITTKPL
ncbi:MAG: 16S rRNA (guanine(527)-N(7))-methyltransferase RsmG [Eubacterium sp.]|nr:16S rRNA (guanine(527)-N(7))-methyltransferase RsmG [Eubacterium sp.]